MYTRDSEPLRSRIPETVLLWILVYPKQWSFKISCKRDSDPYIVYPWQWYFKISYTRYSYPSWSSIPNNLFEFSYTQDSFKIWYTRDTDSSRCRVPETVILQILVHKRQWSFEILYTRDSKTVNSKKPLFQKKFKKIIISKKKPLFQNKPLLKN